MVYKCLLCNKYTCKYPCECQQNMTVAIHTSTGSVVEWEDIDNTWAKNIFKKLLDRRNKL